MELFLDIILFLNFLYNSFEIVPIWKMTSAAINLQPSTFTDNKKTYYTYSRSGHKMSGTLRKELIVNGDKIERKRYLSLDGGSEFEVTFEDLESVYDLSNLVGKKVICPRGKYHPYVYENGQLYEMIPGGFNQQGNGNWDLKCYYHGAGSSSSENGKGFFLVFYLMNGKASNFNADFNKDSSQFRWEACKSNNGAIEEELYDFRLEYGTIAYQGTSWMEYKMIGLVSTGNSLLLKSYVVKFESNSQVRQGIQINGQGSSRYLTESKKYNQGYIYTDENNNPFFFISYNNVSDFTCGYSTNGFYTDNYYYYNNIKFNISSDSPFEFIDEVEIKEMNFISSNRYVYYAIYNKETNETYHGLLDVKTNKIMFNTNETLDTFIPYSDNSILAIKGSSAYRICPIINDEGNDCIEDCTEEGKWLIRDIEKNICGTACPDSNKYLLVPDYICITSCDTSIYVVNEENKQCGLCKYMDEDKPYRFIGGDQCLSNIPEGAYEYNTKLKLLKCSSGYKTDPSNVNGCVTNCHRTCKTCSDISDNDEDPKCLTCDTDIYYLEGEKCLEIIRTNIISTETISTNIIPTEIITTNIISTETISTNIISTEIISTNIISTETITTNIKSTETITTNIISTETITTNIISTEITEKPKIAPPPTTIITTIPTTVITTIPTTIITTIPTTVPLICPDEKCLTCNEESNSLGLCLSCNEALGYKKVNYTLVLINFLDCIKPESPQAKKYYYNETSGVYRPCYKTCKQCLKGGNAEANYCLECENNYMFRPGYNPYNNCVAYSEFYYISSYNQYKSLPIYQCPEEAKYYIKKRKSCIDDCKKDEEYKYLYNGNCLKQCPSGTRDINYVCVLSNNLCTLGKNEIFLSYNDNLEIISTLIKSYISEFYYTDNYVSHYQHTNYSIMIYKNRSCITELNLQMPNVDFQSCYTKVQNEYSINQDLIIVIVDKKESNNAKTFYSFYHPLSGLKLDAEEVCKNETIVVKESLTSVLGKNDSGTYETQTSLTSQGINIFDLNDPFYTDICYDFDNPLKKDIPLNDRIKTLYPDVELCDEGCEIKSINLEDMTSTCNCTFNDIASNNLIKDNPLAESSIGEIFDLINSSNILVFKCFKNIFTHFSRSIGGWISLTLIIGQVGSSLTFFLVQSTQVSKYLFNLTKGYIQHLSSGMTKYPPKRGINNQNKTEKIKISEVGSESNSKKEKNPNIYKDKNSAKDMVIPYYDKNKLKTSEDLNINTYHDLKLNQITIPWR